MTEPTDPVTDAVAATVVIPTLNGERYLAEALDAIAAQRFAGGIETLVIDSGSSDGTLDIVRARPWVRLHEIPQAEFGHGRTRGLGARMARGRLVAFLTQDAIPAGPDWLAELTAPLEREGVVAVVGRQIPRARCFPLMRYDIVDTFRAQGADDETVVVRLPAGASATELDRASFYSDVNSASTREVLTERIPLRDVPYSEDIAFARDVLLAGLGKAYAGRAAVVHSNDMGVRRYAERIDEETTALIRTGVGVPRHGVVGLVARWARGVLRDSIRIARDPAYGPLRTLGWLAADPFFQAARWIGYARATRRH